MPNSFQALLIELVEIRTLSNAQFEQAFSHILSGQINSGQIAAFLTTLKLLGEKPEQLVALAKTLKSVQKTVTVEHTKYLVDNCGTGGDGANLVNISTAAAFVASSAGAQVAKHGNRGISSNSGSADVLESLEANLALSCNQIAQCLEKIHLAFMFAPQHHAAIAHVGAVRKLLGYRTIFNLVGPLVNPANVKHQLIGVFDQKWLHFMAEAAVLLGAKHVMVVHSHDGLNELSIADKTNVVEYCEGKKKAYTVCPEDVGLDRFLLDSLKVKSPEQSAKMIREAFLGQHKPAQAMIALNAGACLYVSGRCSSLQAGVDKAKMVIESGQAVEKLDAFVQLTQSFE